MDYLEWKILISKLAPSPFYKSNSEELGKHPVKFAMRLSRVAPPSSSRRSQVAQLVHCMPNEYQKQQANQPVS